MRQQAKGTKSSKKTFFAVAFVVVAISLMIFSGVGASLWGVELHAVEQEIAGIENENRRLTGEMVMYTSLTRVNENTKDMNFAKPENVVYLNKEVPVLGYAQ